MDLAGVNLLLGDVGNGQNTKNAVGNAILAITNAHQQLKSFYEDAIEEIPEDRMSNESIWMRIGITPMTRSKWARY